MKGLFPTVGVPTTLVKTRRQKLLKQLEDQKGVLILLDDPSKGSRKPDSDLYYLTGLIKPTPAALVLNPHLETPEWLFYPVPDAVKILWEGQQLDFDDVRSLTGIEKIEPWENFPNQVAPLLRGCQRLYWLINRWPNWDRVIFEALEKERLIQGRTGRGLLDIQDPRPLIGELRVIKDSHEKQQLELIAQISAQAHRQVMEWVLPGHHERNIYGYWLWLGYQHEVWGEAYPAIVASGPNACTLHYVDLWRSVQEEDWMLLDAGFEWFYMASDITRTWPVNPEKIHPDKRQLYQAVLDLQKNLITRVKPGVTWEELQNAAIEGLIEILLDWGLVTGSVQQVWETGTYKRFYPHNIGHYLGIDVHDAGLYKLKNGQSRPLEPGMAITIEPGLYIPAHEPHPLRGFGIRIEDDIWVTPQGAQVLTEAAPKQWDEIIACRQKAWSQKNATKG